MKTKVIFIAGVVLVACTLLTISSYFFSIPFKFKTEGEKLDEFNGVEVYFNGYSNHIDSRNVTEDSYNVGLRWQCVEFVKRYYLEVYGHKMPNSYGNAVDLYNPKLKDGSLNSERGLIQYSNPSKEDVSVGDIVIFSGGYGHVAIVSKVHKTHIEIIQQNVGMVTREEFEKSKNSGMFLIEKDRIIGRLRMPN